MAHAVKLEKLPDGVEFPPDLRGVIAFEASPKRLVFRGFMSKATYDRLRQLHTDMKYAQAVDELFRLSAMDEVPQLRRLGSVLRLLVIFCLAFGVVVWWQLLR
ncbi:MAG: hypothetical protein L0Z62_14890 [Gemmataceae bacterium]|nr:hypothetical protein [Gemmataceae bacterium]